MIVLNDSIMLISDLFCLAIVLGVAFSTQLWQVYLLLFLKSSFVALFIPAKNGKVKEIVAENQIQAAIGISSMIDNGAKIIGPVLSGLFVATTPAIYLQAFLYVYKGTTLDTLKYSMKLVDDSYCLLNPLLEGSFCSKF